MRRLFSITLLALFLWPSLAAWFLPSTAEQLPMCCRANGKHHCAMMLQKMAQTSAKPGVALIGERCPVFPKALVWNSSHLGTTPGEQSARNAVFPPTQLIAQVEAEYRVAWSRSRQKRGPPALA